MDVEDKSRNTRPSILPINFLALIHGDLCSPSTIMGSHRSKVLSSNDIDGLAAYISSGKCKNIAFMVR